MHLLLLPFFFFFLSFFLRNEPRFESGIANQVKVELNFTLHQLKLAIALTDKELEKEKECLELTIDDIVSQVSLRRWDLFATANIGRLVLNEMTIGINDEPFEILSTPKNTKMLEVTYRKCEFNESMSFGPSYFYSDEAQIRALHYKNEYQETEQILDIQLSTLNMVLHQEALLNILSLIYQVLDPLNKRGSETSAKLKRGISFAGSKMSLSIEEKSNTLQRPALSSKTEEAAQELKNRVGLEDEKKIRVTASMDGVSIIVCSSKVDLAEAYVKGLSANVLMKDTILEIKASMKDMQVQDNGCLTKYKNILSMQSEEVFSLELAMMEGATTGSKMFDMSLVDTKIKLSFGRMRVVFLYRFIIDFLAFIENFEDAKNAVIEAGKAATSKAVEAVSEISKHNSRIQLNILLNAPTIIIPVGSNSEMALLVDLGELKIYNSFKLLNDDRYHRNTVITDKLTIKFSNLTLMKSLIKDGGQIVHQRSIIEPMSLQVIVVRNLTQSNHSIPDIAVIGQMPFICISLSEEDVTVIMKILKGNVAEGAIQTETKKDFKKKSKQLDVYQDRLASIYEEPELGTNSPLVPYLQTKLEFELIKIDLKLFLKPPDMTFEDEFLPRSDDCLLSVFTIGNLTFKGDIYSDQAMKMILEVETLILDDMRPLDEEGIKRMVNYTPEPLIEEIKREQLVDASNKMIVIEFEQAPSLDKTVKVILSNMLCIFNVEFIVVLLRTIQAAIPMDDDDSDLRSSFTSDDSSQHISGGSDDESEKSLDANQIIASEDVRRSEIKLNLHVHNPQVVLLSDAKNVKTNALFLTTEINFNYYQLQDVQKIIGAVSNTAILSTAFKKEHRSDISTVLSLDSINLLSSAPLEAKPHINVTFSLIKLNISPKTIRTLTACSGHLVSQPNDEDFKRVHEAMTKLWNIGSLQSKKCWYLNHPPQSVLSAGSFVLSRTFNGEYVHGFLAKKDSLYTVYFYPEGQINHKVTDVSSVVLDLPPLESELYVGCNILAILSKEKGYRTGRIMQVSVNTKFNPGY